MIQIRNVPDELHRRAKARAALEGISLSALLLRELTLAMARPTRAEMLARIRSRERVANLAETPADILRAERDAR
jgi:plasmid stability protein